jgi:hypothetical protein
VLELDEEFGQGSVLGRVGGDQLERARESGAPRRRQLDPLKRDEELQVVGRPGELGLGVDVRERLEGERHRGRDVVVLGPGGKPQEARAVADVEEKN